jgi:hypothetical protein
MISLALPMTTSNIENEAASGCNISLSYDGISYSNHQTILMYDKQQYDCDVGSLTCIHKEVSRMKCNTDKSTGIIFSHRYWKDTIFVLLLHNLSLLLQRGTRIQDNSGMFCFVWFGFFFFSSPELKLK